MADPSESASFSWAKPALRVAAYALQLETIREHPEVVALVEQMRDRLFATSESPSSVQDLMHSINERVEAIIDQTKVASSASKMAHGEQLKSDVQQVADAMQLLADLHAFQVENLAERRAQNRKFTLKSQGKFVQMHPKYGPSDHLIRARIRNVFGCDYRTLVGEMDLPIIADLSDETEVKRKLADNLWEIYNAKNGFPPDNRRYRPGTRLPLLVESIYDQQHFGKAFGGFPAAVTEIILRNEQEQGGQTAERPDENTVRQLIELSLSEEQMPDIPATEVAAVKRFLEEDFKNALDETTTSVPTPKDFGRQRAYLFYWRHLLMHSKYFGEYGIKIYEMWLGREKLEALTNHRVSHIEHHLKTVLLKPAPLAHMRGMPRLFKMPKEDIAVLDSMSRAQLISYVEEKILRVPFAKTAKPAAENIRYVLRRFAEAGITIPPIQTHFVNPASIDNLIAKAEYFRSHPEVPFYMRQVLFGANVITVATIERRKSLLAEHGANPAYYAHCLHLAGDYWLRQNARTLIDIEKRYQQTLAHLAARAAAVKTEEAAKPESVAARIREMLLPHLGEADIPPPEKLANLDPRLIGHRIEAVVQRGETVTAAVLGDDFKSVAMAARQARKKPENDQACERLRELGYPYEDLSARTRRSLTPTNILGKVELHLELFGTVCRELLNRSAEQIRQFAASKAAGNTAAETAEAQLQAMLAERGVAPPPPYIAGKRSASGLIANILEIEARGVPFKTEYWGCLHATKHQRDASIETTWRRLTKDQRLTELAEIYGFEFDDVPRTLIRRIDPDTLREYCRIIAAAGRAVESHWWDINSNTLVSFRARLAGKLRKTGEIPALLPDEKNWLHRQNLVETLKEKLNVAEIDGTSVEELLDEASLKELVEISQCTEQDELMEKLKQLKKRFVDRKTMEKLLRRYRLNYCDMDFCGASPERVQFTLERIRLLERLHEPVNQDTLYADFDEIDPTAFPEDEAALSAEQQQARLYLYNIDCFPLLAEKLCRSGISLLEFRGKVEFFRAVPLCIEDHGKDQAETCDFEDYLDKPMGYCRRRGVQQMRKKLANEHAKSRLRDALQLEWDSESGFAMRRTLPITMWHKYIFLSEIGALRESAEAMPELVTRYSVFSLTELRAFAVELNAVIGDRMSVEEKDLYIQVAIWIIHTIASYTTNATIKAKLVQEAKNRMMAGDLERIITDIRGKGKSEPELQTAAGKVSRESAMRIYGEIIKIMTPSLTKKEELELGRLKDEGNTEARDQLVMRNLGLAVKIARQYRSCGIPMQDLIQQGNEGLIVAANKFDHKLGFKFSTYAMWWVRQKIYRYIQENRRAVHVPIGAQESHRMYQQVFVGFIKARGRPPQPEEIADLLGMETEEVKRLKQEVARMEEKEVRLDAPAYRGGDDTNLDAMAGPAICANAEITPRSQFMERFRALFFEKFRSSDRDRAWDIFINRFGFTETGDSMTLKDLGQKHRITRERIRQIETKVLDFIKRHPDMVEIAREMI